MLLGGDHCIIKTMMQKKTMILFKTMLLELKWKHKAEKFDSALNTQMPPAPYKWFAN